MNVQDGQPTQRPWRDDRCAECGVEAHNGTENHPPLCEKCAALWYPADPPEYDCRSCAT